MLDSQKNRQFPSEAIFVKDPTSQNELDLQPLLKLLHERYRGDKDYLVEALEDLGEYLIHEETPCDSAKRLRYMLGIVNTLMTAFDSMTIRKGPRTV